MTSLTTHLTTASTPNLAIRFYLRNKMIIETKAFSSVRLYTTTQVFLTAVLLACISVTTQAADKWRKVSGDEIDGILADREVIYEGELKSSQTFNSNGTTTYVEGRPSAGNWKVIANQYCSEWPPNSNWACYDLFVDASGNRIRFTNASGHEWIGQFQPL